MKRLSVALLLACALAIPTGIALAAEGAEAPKKPKMQKKPRQKAPKKARKARLMGEHARMVTVCGLSEEQQKQIAQLNAERAKAMKAFNTENADQLKALREDMKKARESKDREARKKAMADSTAIRAKQNEIIKKFRADVTAVLTPEQKTKWDEHVALTNATRRIRGVKLTDEQKAAVAAAYTNLATGVDMTDRKASAKVYADLGALIRKEILTDEQKITLAMQGILRRYGKAKLTDEQTEQAKAAYVKHTTGANMSDKKVRGEVLKKVNAEIQDQILTEEQREAVKHKPKAPKPRAPGKPKQRAKE